VSRISGQCTPDEVYHIGDTPGSGTVTLGIILPAHTPAAGGMECGADYLPGIMRMEAAAWALRNAQARISGFGVGES